MPLTLTFTPSGHYQCPGLSSQRDLVVRDALGLEPALLIQAGCQDCPRFPSCPMSHWTEMKTSLTDITALTAACAELNLPISTAPGLARGYQGQRRQADHVIRCPGPYDIAVTKAKDGTLTLNTDWFLGHVEKAVGRDYGLLLQRYAICKAHAAARAKGWTTTRTHDQATGKILLTITVP